MRVIKYTIRILAITLGLFIVVLILPSQVKAFNAGNIISDGKFTNSSSMNEVDIQNFLISKNSVCLRNYQTPEPLGSNNYGGNVSAARAIWKAGQLFGINPQVLLVTLQKENGMITRSDCPDWRYRTAMGFGCPDGAPCDAQWFGLSKQLYQGARHFRGYYDQQSGWFIPFTPGVRYIPYNPNGGCGGSNVNIVNRATASLYSYTPYQPNAAAINNLYGLGDGCSAYGNRNFWRDMSAWFPDVTVMTSPDGSKLYVNEGGISKRWIPNMDVFTAWGLGNLAHVDVPAGTFNAIPEKPALSRLMSYQGGPIYLMDNGEKHWITSSDLLTLWGFTMANVGIVDSSTLAAIPSGRNVSRFMQSTDTNDGSVWLADVGIKHYIPTSQVLSDWGFAGEQDITYISPALINSKTAGDNASKHINVWGTRYLVVDGKTLQFPNSEMVRTWGFDDDVATAMNIDPIKFLQSKGSAKILAQAEGDGSVYFVEGGKKHYLPDIDNLINFGYNSSSSISVLPNEIIATLTASTNATSPIVNEAETGAVYALDGRRNYIPTTDILSGWTSNIGSIPSYSRDSLSQLPNGITLSPLIQASGDGAVYVLNKGSKLYIPDLNTLNAWGYPRVFQISHINLTLSRKLSSSPTIVWQYIDNGTNKYLLNDGYYHKVSSTVANIWGLSGAVVVDSSAINRLSAGQDLQRNVRFGGNYYLVDHQQRIKVNGWNDAYGLNDSNTTTMSKPYYQEKLGSSVFVQSTDSSDGRVWLMNRGEKYYIQNPDQLRNLGFGVIGLSLLRFSPELLANIPTFNDSFNPLVIRRQNDFASKLLIGNGFLSFSDSPTLSAWAGDGSNVLIVSDSIFFMYSHRGEAQRTINAPDGKVYYVENGTKCWITSYATFVQSYSSNKMLIPPQFTVNLIPNGSNIP